MLFHRAICLFDSWYLLYQRTLNWLTPKVPTAFSPASQKKKKKRGTRHPHLVLFLWFLSFPSFCDPLLGLSPSVSQRFALCAIGCHFFCTGTSDLVWLRCFRPWFNLTVWPLNPFLYLYRCGPRNHKTLNLATPDPRCHSQRSNHALFHRPQRGGLRFWAARWVILPHCSFGHLFCCCLLLIWLSFLSFLCLVWWGLSRVLSVLQFLPSPQPSRFRHFFFFSFS